jgi:hypothetical protein
MRLCAIVLIWGCKAREPSPATEAPAPTRAVPSAALAPSPPWLADADRLYAIASSTRPLDCPIV